MVIMKKGEKMRKVLTNENEKIAKMVNEIVIIFLETKELKLLKKVE